VDPGPDRRPDRLSFPVRYTLRVCLSCCTVWVSVRRCRSTGRSSVMMRRWRPGGGRCGRRQKVAAECGAWICFQGGAGHTLRPPKMKTWAPREHTRYGPT
jgi:hypothetical protein